MPTTDPLKALLNAIEVSEGCKHNLEAIAGNAMLADYLRDDAYKIASALMQLRMDLATAIGKLN